MESVASAGHIQRTKAEEGGRGHILDDLLTHTPQLSLYAAGNGSLRFYEGGKKGFALQKNHSSCSKEEQGEGG